MTADSAASAASGTPVLEVQGLRAAYGETPILQGVDMTVGRGEIVALIGRNGVGKTTTLRCLMGLLRARGWASATCRRAARCSRA